MASHDSETPAIGQQVITACAFVHRTVNGIPQVFLPKRAATKKFLPGNFELPGGHINWGEDVVAGLKREVREELGMDIIIGNPFAAFTYVNEIKKSHSIEVIYFATFVGPVDTIRLDPEDHSEYIWADAKTASQLQEMSPEEKGVVLKGLVLLGNQRRRSSGAHQADTEPLIIT